MISRKSTIIVILSVILLFGVIGAQTVEAQNVIDQQEKQMDVEMTPHERYDSEENQIENIGNHKNVTTNKDVWNREEGMPKGVYRGPAMRPSLYEMKHNPYWRNEYGKDGNFKSTGEYGHTNLMQEVEVSSDKIQNGASEFHVQVPVHADSLHTHKVQSQQYVQDSPDDEGIIGDEGDEFVSYYFNMRENKLTGKYRAELYDDSKDSTDVRDEEYTGEFKYDSNNGNDRENALDEVVNNYMKPKYGKYDEDPIWAIYNWKDSEILERGAEISDYSSVKAHSNYFSSIHVYKGEIDNLETTMDSTRVNARSSAEANGEKVQPEAVVPIRPQDVHGNRPYVKMNMFFESDTTYTFVYNILTGGEELQLFTTSSENFGKLRVQNNREKVNEVKHGTIANRSKPWLFTKDMASLPFSMSDTWHPDSDDEEKRYMWRNSHIFIDNSTNIMRESEETDIRLATSFVFTKGVGASQLFGHEVKFEKGDVFQFYPKFDWSEHQEFNDSSSKDRLSFYLPFISSDYLGERKSQPENIGIDIDISFGSRMLGHRKDIYDFSDSKSDRVYHINNENIDWNYEDFILYTEPEEWEVASPSLDNPDDMYGRNAWQIRFNEPATVTFLCSGRERERPSNIDEEINDNLGYGEYYWHGANAMHLSPENYMDMDRRKKAIDIHQSHLDDDKEDPLNFSQYPYDVGNNESFEGTFEPFFYDIYSPAEITESVWMKENDSEGQGMEAYSHAFHVAEYYSNISYQMVDEEGGVIWVNQTDDDGSATARDYLSNLWSKFKSGALTLAEGANDLSGNLKDGLYWIYDKIQEAFDVIYEVLTEFVDIVWGIIQDIGNILGELFYRLGYIAGLLGFVFLVGGIAKVLNFADWNQKFKNRRGGK